MQRERLGSQLGFIMLSAACAIGLGNVWKFPYMAGQYGGGVFVLFYIVFLIIFGIPVLVSEYAMGRGSQISPIRFYQALEPKGSKWHLHGPFAMFGLYLLMMFYVNVAGWIVKYFVRTVSGGFQGMNADEVAGAFVSFISEPGEMLLYMALVVIVGFLICSFSLQKGLERITKYVMLALFVIMLVLAVNSFTMEGAKEGLSFYLKPDMARAKEAGLGNVVVGAMSQAFFTLGLGVGSMAIFGSYIDKSHSLLGESVKVVALDTFVALMAGFIIFPACFTHGVDVTSGPPLIFITLPNIFLNLPMGRFWGSLFFLFMTFAAVSTVLAVFEDIVACCMDLFGWSRKKTCLINAAVMLVLAMPCALGFNVWSGFMPFGEGSNVLDLEDFVLSNVLLPVGAFLFVRFCTSEKGWGWDNFVAEANAGKGMKMKKWMRPYMSYFLPVLVLILFVVGIVNFFG
ncbi:MAG: sodium-dependent transporter [Oscillospiraceae bacterium]|nr:sodium-dependent transporter [Oscillospiraceae bacterium]